MHAQLLAEFGITPSGTSIVRSPIDGTEIGACVL